MFVIIEFTDQPTVLGLDAADRENLVAALIGQSSERLWVDKTDTSIARDIPHDAALDLVNLFPRRKFQILGAWLLLMPF